MELHISLDRAAGRRPVAAPAVAAVLLIGAALHWPSCQSLWEMWNAPGSYYYSHGDLIALGALWLLWRRRGLLAAAQGHPSWTGTLLLLPLSVLWFIVVQADFSLGEQACLPLILLTSLWAVCGSEMARVCMLPVGFLYFAIPVWDVLLSSLRQLTILMSWLILQLLQIPVTVQGPLLRIPNGVFEIEPGCAGLMYLVIALAIATFEAERRRVGLRDGLLLGALAGSLALLGNWVRVVTVVVSGYLTDMQHYFVKVSHDSVGWAIFAGMMVVFLLLSVHVEVGVPPADAVLTSGARPQTAVGRVLALLILALAPAVHLYAVRSEPAVAGPRLLIPAVSGWAGPLRVGTGMGWSPVFIGADRRQMAVYQRDSAEIQLYAASYFVQSRRAKLHGTGNTLVGPGSAVLSSSRVQWGGLAGSLKETLDTHGRHWLIWSQYQVGGFQTASLALAQLVYALESVWEVPVSRVIGLRAVCGPEGCSSRQRDFSAFLGATGGFREE